MTAYFYSKDFNSKSETSPPFLVCSSLNMKEVEESLFADDIILHIQNPAYAIKKLLELINEFSTVRGYKNEYTKICCVSYTNIELSEKLRQQSHLRSKGIKYLEINLTEVRDLYQQLKDIKERN